MTGCGCALTRRCHSDGGEDHVRSNGHVWGASVKGALRRIAGVLSVVCTACVLSIVALGVVELGARALSKTPTPGPRATADALKAQPQAEEMLAEIYSGQIQTQFAPYVHYRLGPYPGSHISIDARGLRSIPGTRTSTHGPTVWMFGGSTLWGMGARDAETIPAQLAAALGPEVRVISFAQVGYNSTQGVLTLLLELQRGPAPDVVVFYDGVNEVLPALKLGEVGVSLDVPRRAQEFNITRPGELARLWSAALSGAARESKVVRWVLGPQARAPVAQIDDVPLMAARVVDAYAANVKAVQGMAQRFGFRTLFFWQPTVFSKAQRSADEATAAGTRADFAPLYAATRDQLPEADLLGVVDLSEVFGDSEQAVFFDFCHVNEAGNRIIAQAMLEPTRQALRP